MRELCEGPRGPRMRMEGGGAEGSTLCNRSTMATADEKRRGLTVCVCLSFHKREIRRSSIKPCKGIPALYLDDGPEWRIEATEFCTRLDLCSVLLLQLQLLSSSSSTGIPLTPQFSRSTKPTNEPTIPHFLQVTTYIPHLQAFWNFFDPTVCNFTQPTSLLHLLFRGPTLSQSPC